MKTTIRGTILTAACLLFASAHQTHAVVGLAIARDCTNIVISWPCTASDRYLIQHRPTLDPSTPWQNLSNNYPANGANLTTFTIYGVTPPCSSGGSSMMMASRASVPVWYPQVMPKDGSRQPVPLNLYPHGIDLTGHVVIWADGSTEDWTPKLAADYEASKALARISELDGPDPQDGGSGGGDGGNFVDSGFFRVFHIPDFPNSITNFTFDGPTFVPVNFKDYRERVEDIQVLLDGQPLSDAVFTSLYYNNQTNWGLGIYFDLFPSGTHQIQLVTTIRLNDDVGDTADLLMLTNVTRQITVDNLVTFTNFDGLIMSSNFTYEAQSKYPNTYWWIDLYDASENYVNGGSGYTANGQISWTWDLTDTFGNPRDNLDYDPFFYAYITLDTPSNSNGPQAGPTVRRGPAPQTEYPNVGSWLISYSDNNYLDGGAYYYPGHQHYMDGITGMRGGIGYRNIPNAGFSIKFGTNYTQAQRNTSWADLKATLFTGQYRNFYYFGHGGGNTIGTDKHVFDTNGFVVGGTRLPNSKAYLASQSVSNELVFNRYSGSKPFRFVWLDGCSTSTGSWPGTFGVDKAPHDIDYYTNNASNPKHRRPNAFVGWNQLIGGPGWGTTLGFWNFRTEWMTRWSYNWQTEGLSQAYQNARQNANWPPGGDSQLWGALRVYGYTNLLFNGYNNKGEWRSP